MGNIYRTNSKWVHNKYRVEAGVFGTKTLADCKMISEGLGLEECEANAKLMAHAPELLEMLERLTRIASVELGRTRPDVIESARELLKKLEVDIAPNYYYVKFEEYQNGRERLEDMLVVVNDGEDVQSKVHDAIMAFWPETKLKPDGYYSVCNDEILIGCINTQQISQEHFEILKQYLMTY